MHARKFIKFARQSFTTKFHTREHERDCLVSPSKIFEEGHIHKDSVVGYIL